MSGISLGIECSGMVWMAIAMLVALHLVWTAQYVDALWFGEWQNLVGLIPYLINNKSLIEGVSYSVCC